MPITQIQPSSGIRIDKSLPGDKSISHRAAIIAAIADGASIIRNLAMGEDVVSTMNNLAQLGVDIESSKNEIRINGKGLFGLKKPNRTLDCGNSGTTARLLAGVLAGQKFESVLTGDQSLLKRPMNRIADPLRLMGAHIEISASGTLPMRINQSSLKGIDYTLEVASAQVKSCVLFAGIYAEGKTNLFEPIPTRDHSERLLSFVRKDFSNGVLKLTIEKPQSINPLNMTIPGDFSSAAFLIAAGAMIPNSQVQLRCVGMNPTRTGMLDILKKMGVRFVLENRFESATEPYGDVKVSYKDGPLKGCSLGGNVIANIIDEIPILAVLGTRTDSGLEVRDASELRKKECDRISAIVYNLRQMGADVEEFEDGFFVYPCKLKPASIRTFGDHRIAMAFTVAAMAADGISTVDDTECISVSFPDFFDYVGMNIRKHQNELLVC